jgi:hypothetical protein
MQDGTPGFAFIRLRHARLREEPERCREHGAARLVWQTARDDHRAQAVYARVGATGDDRWLDYELPVQPV